MREGRRPVAEKASDPATTALSRRDVHVWRVALPPTEDTGALTDDERERAERLVSPAARAAFIGRRSALRRILGSYIGVAPTDLRFDHGPNGKPSLEGQRLEFNSSQAGASFVCAVTTGMVTGIDIESRAAATRADQIADRILSDRERGSIDTLDEEDRRFAILRAWTRKEAVAKGMGEGMALPFRSIDTTGTFTAGVVLVRVAHRPRGRWFVRDLAVADGYVASLATPRRRIRITYMDWPIEGEGPPAVASQ
jgi:4'-phosphopantetheinyl transferase